MRSRFLAAAMLAACFALMPVLTMHALAATAPAASDTVAVTTPATVAIPYGDWITLALAWARDGFLALASYAVMRWAPNVLKSMLTEQVLARAVDYGIAAVDGAVKGRVLDVKVANQVIEAAADYAIRVAPSLAKRLGDLLKPKLLARLSAAGSLPENASAIGVTLTRAGG